jgi:TPP-dependent pyruvate/acetoin dehydrogenase alpha subunit
MALPATRPTAAIPTGAALSNEQLLEIYYFLRLTRTLEERLVALYRQTKVIGGLFRSLGQEGESVGSAYALERGRNKDILSPLIRNLGSMLVMGAKPVEILRQYMAKAESPTHGREMNVHFNDLEQGYLGQISHLGDMIPVMAGITLSFKMRREPRVGLVYIGSPSSSSANTTTGRIRLLPKSSSRSKTLRRKRKAMACRPSRWTATTSSRCMRPPGSPSSARAGVKACISSK